MFFRRATRERRSAEARASGRIDVVGGFIRHHGGLVLESPIDPSARVSVQEVEGHSVAVEREGEEAVSVDFRPFEEVLRRKGPRSELAGLLRRAELPESARLAVGCLLIFCETRVWVFKEGLRVSIRSDIPSAGEAGDIEASEIALLLALEKLAGRQFLTTEAARIAQQAETDLMGRPTALADKMAPAYGTPGSLLPILCQPERLYPEVSLPGDVVLAVWPGGEACEERRRAALKARTAVFVGWRCFENAIKRAWHHTADIPLSLFERYAGETVPRSLRGSDFLERLEPEVPFPLQVEPGEVYEGNKALRTVLEEQARTAEATSLVRNLDDGNREEILGRFGDCMVRSHEGYAALGLGSAAADRRVEALMAFGPGRGVYGARLCGEGIAGTVVALVKRETLSLVGAPVLGSFPSALTSMAFPAG